MSIPSTVSVSLAATLETTETATTASAPAMAAKSVLLRGFDFAQTLTSASAVPAQVASYQAIIATASGTIDLTALKTLFSSAVDCTGMKLNALQINNLDATNNFTIQVGASNGYAIGGNPLTVKPGGSALIYFNGKLGAVGPSAKTLDWTGNVSTGNAQAAFILG